MGKCDRASGRVRMHEQGDNVISGVAVSFALCTRNLLCIGATRETWRTEKAYGLFPVRNPSAGVLIKQSAEELGGIQEVLSMPTPMRARRRERHYNFF